MLTTTLDSRELKFLVRQIDEYIQVTEFMIRKTAALEHGELALARGARPRAGLVPTAILSLSPGESKARNDVPQLPDRDAAGSGIDGSLAKCPASSFRFFYFRFFYVDTGAGIPLRLLPIVAMKLCQRIPSQKYPQKRQKRSLTSA